MLKCKISSVFIIQNNYHKLNIESFSFFTIHLGKQWKSLRSKLTPAFSSGKLKNMFHLLVECSKNFQNQIESKLESKGEPSTMDIRELTTNFTIDVIGSCAFGIQTNALTNRDSEFRKLAKKLSNPNYKTTLWRMLRTAFPKLYKLLGVQVK